MLLKILSNSQWGQGPIMETFGQDSLEEWREESFYHWIYWVTPWKTQNCLIGRLKKYKLFEQCRRRRKGIYRKVRAGLQSVILSPISIEKEYFMRIRSLALSFVASLFLLGFAGQASAVPSCADQNLPDFARDLNKNTEWNNYVAAQLASNPTLGVTQLKQGFQTQQCDTAWQKTRTTILVSQRSCSFDAPIPSVSSGTTVNYQATSNPANNAILKLRGCGGKLEHRAPAQLGLP